MRIQDNFDLIRLFINKFITISVDNQDFNLRVPTISDLLLNKELSISYNLWTASLEKLQKDSGLKCDSSLEFVLKILFELNIYKEFENLSRFFETALQFFIPDVTIDYVKKHLIVNEIIITDEVWDYILYLIKRSQGEKVEKPPTFQTEQDRQNYLAQKKLDDKIKRIKQQNAANADPNGLLKIFLSITYAFPSLTFDYLFNQTMAQIHWLQEYAAGSVSYEVNAKAFAAGNIKKGSKLDFFIK